MHIPSRPNLRLCIILMLAVMLCASYSALAASPDDSHALKPTFEKFSLNVQIFRFVNDHRVPALDGFFHAFAPRYWVLPVIVLFVAAWRNRSARVILVAVVAVAIETAIVQLLKQTTDLPRPTAALPAVHHLFGLTHGSLPSGDAAFAFVMAASLTRFLKRWALVLMYVYGVFVAYERMYVGVHFPLDVLIGAAIGIACGYGATLWLAPRKPQPEEPNP